MLFQSVCDHLIFSVRYHFSAVRNILILSDFRITILLHFHTIKHSDLFDLTSFFFSSPFPQCITFALPALHPTPSPSTRNAWSQDAITCTCKSQDQATSNVLLFSFSVYLSTFVLEELLDSEFGFIERGMRTEKQASRTENQKFSPVKLWISIKLIATE